MAKKKEIVVEEEEVVEEENSADKIADLTIQIDSLKDKNEEMESELAKYKKKYEDEHNANKRLMARINEREELYEAKEEAKKVEYKPTKLSDLYDFKKGCLTLRK